MPKSKKQKLDEAEKDPVVYFDPQRIPIEVWNQILHYISVRDLLSLSLVCKAFLETINILPEAIDKIKLNLNKETLKDEALILQSSRNYTNIRLKSIQDIETCKKIIAKFGENLRILEFNFCHFSDEESNSILEMTQKNLKTLSIIWANFKENSQSTALALEETSSNSQSTALALRTFKLSKLQSLKIFPYDLMCYNGDVLDFMPDTLLEVIYDIVDEAIESQFLQFLERQKNLKSLTVTSWPNVNFLNKFSDAKINFKLEKLDMKSSQYVVPSENLNKFLRSQADSLKELTLRNISLNSIKETFKNMPNLQLLDVRIWEETTEQYVSGPSFNCPSLKTLIIDLYEDFNLSFLYFVKGFRSVPKIVLKMKMNSTIIQAIAENHPNLKALALDNFEDSFFNSLSFKNLTELEILFDDASVQEYSDINMERSVLAMENLEVLKFAFDHLVTATSLLWILVNFKKLNHLEIENGSKLSMDLLCRNVEFFKNLRYLEIDNLKDPVENLVECLAQFPQLKICVSQEKEQ